VKIEQATRFSAPVRWPIPARPERLLLVPVAALVGYLTIVPLGYLFWRALSVGGGFSLRFLHQAYGVYGLGALLSSSVEFAAGSAALAVGLGTLTAYALARTNVPTRRLFFAVALLPLLVPGVLYTISWIFLASPRTGALNVALRPAAGTGALDVFSLGGMIVVEGLHLAPIALLLMTGAFRAVDGALEESALASGASARTVFRRVTLPLVRPALSATVLIVAVSALEAFEVPALLGPPARVWVFTSRIWLALSTFPPSAGDAAAYALPLLALTALGVLVHTRLTRTARSYETITGRGFTPPPVALGRWRWPATAALAVYLAVAALLPLLLLLYVSTQRFYTGVSAGGFAHMGLGAYRGVLTDPEFRRATAHSLLLGVGCATAVMVVTTVLAWFTVRLRVRGRTILDLLAFLPIAIPGVVLGVALLVVYLRVPLPIYGTLWILLIAYFTRFMPFGIRAASVSMAQVGRELEESAYVSGAGWVQTFRRVLVPLLAPGLVAGWLYVLLVSLRELASSLLLYSPGKEVLPVVIWERYQSGELSQLAAMGVLMTAGTLVLAAAGFALARRTRVA
jgi:iron(III) transport system permease protein